MTTNKKIIEEISEEVGGEVRYDYSGRGMFGRQCMGIVTGNPQLVIDLAKKHRKLKQYCQDNMGLEYIIYWPYVTKES